MPKEAGITKYIDLDSKFGAEDITPCLGIPGRRQSGKNSTQPEKLLPLIVYNTSTHRELTSGRANFYKPNQSGLGFPVLNQFSGLGHQNPPLHK